jgi:hypothetical protein
MARRGPAAAVAHFFAGTLTAVQVPFAGPLVLHVPGHPIVLVGAAENAGDGGALRHQGNGDLDVILFHRTFEVGLP